MKRSLPKNPGKILIRSTNWIGDAVMTTPAVRTIRENFPDSEISILVLPWVSDIFRCSPRVDTIITYDKKGRHQGLAGKWHLARELNAYNFDCAILLQNAFEAALITTLARIPCRGGYTTDARGLLLSHGVRKSAAIHKKHQVHYYQEMVQGLGLHPGDDALELFIPQSVQQATREKLLSITNGKIETSPLIGFNPGAAYGPAKRWPAQKYADLAGAICSNHEAYIAVFGTAADNEAAQCIKQSVPDPSKILDYTGKTNLIEAMALIEQCNAFVTNDSGLMHVAAALKVPLAAIFGSTDHIATGPFSNNSVIIRKPLPCSPCKQTHCPEKHLRCLREISPDEVLTAVTDLLHTQAYHHD
ncbi:lipopolysaccharide heptosyltransferase II [Desulfogranum marinum]|uniref:lipopolysaccharide heptosyltransferase II n=1 Tax=Desulfogranum marinum TaxID=453220 RepID=UPI001E2BA35A|nr:lipopolysaccharide heptosyltransferase II [Desulfogranum marinum]